MHCLNGLQQLNFTFQLRGGTSLSKGHQIIGRFSEDIDILVEPPAGRDVKTGKNQNSNTQIQIEVLDDPAREGARSQTCSGRRPPAWMAVSGG